MKPILIGGVERSGTTMLGSMLGAPLTHICPPEMPFKTAILESGAGANGWDAASLRKEILRDPKAELQGWRIKEQSWLFDRVSPPQAVREVVRAYSDLVGRHHPEVWIDHTPNNARRASLLMQAFPDASFVHIVRDGRAVAASLMKLEWGPNSVHRAARYWLEGLSFGLAAETFFPERSVRIRYEDVVSDPDKALRALCEALGIPFDRSMLEGGGLEVAGYTKDQHALVGAPANAARITGWQRDLSAREIEIFEAVVGDVLPLLGYDLRHGLTARPVTARERLSGEAGDLFRRRVLNKVRKRARFRAARR